MMMEEEPPAQADSQKQLHTQQQQQPSNPSDEPSAKQPEKEEEDPKQICNGVDAKGRIVPFLIEVYHRPADEPVTERRFKRPKLGLKKLTEQKKLVPLEIDIPVDEVTVIKERFDWDLAKSNVSPSEFVSELAKSLHLDRQTSEKIKLQILSQIVDHIKNHTKRKKPEEKEFPDDTFLRPAPQIIPVVRFNNDNIEEDPGEQNEKKRMSRQRRMEVQKRYPTPVYNPTVTKYFKEKKTCKNCTVENVTPGLQCRECKLPFHLMEVLNLEDERTKVAIRYYQKVANRIPSLIYEARQKKIDKEDFSSFYSIYSKVKSLFDKSTDMSKDNQNQAKYIVEKYHEFFLNGDAGFNQDCLIYDKDARKDLGDDENRVPRKRGRPRKIPVDPSELLPDPTEESDSSDSDDSSDSQRDEPNHVVPLAPVENPV